MATRRSWRSHLDTWRCFPARKRDRPGNRLSSSINTRAHAYVHGQSLRSAAENSPSRGKRPEANDASSLATDVKETVIKETVAMISIRLPTCARSCWRSGTVGKRWFVRSASGVLRRRLCRMRRTPARRTPFFTRRGSAGSRWEPPSLTGRPSVHRRGSRWSYSIKVTVCLSVCLRVY